MALSQPVSAVPSVVKHALGFPVCSDSWITKSPENSKFPRLNEQPQILRRRQGPRSAAKRNLARRRTPKLQQNVKKQGFRVSNFEVFYLPWISPQPTAYNANLRTTRLYRKLHPQVQLTTPNNA
jgi:hypothetical protein